MQKSVIFLEHPILVPVFFIYPWRNRSRVRVFFVCILGIAHNQFAFVFKSNLWKCFRFRALFFCSVSACCCFYFPLSWQNLFFSCFRIISVVLTVSRYLPHDFWDGHYFLLPSPLARAALQSQSLEFRFNFPQGNNNGKRLQSFSRYLNCQKPNKISM